MFLPERFALVHNSYTWDFLTKIRCIFSMVGIMQQLVSFENGTFSSFLTPPQLLASSSRWLLKHESSSTSGLLAMAQNGPRILIFFLQECQHQSTWRHRYQHVHCNRRGIAHTAVLLPSSLIVGGITWCHVGMQELKEVQWWPVLRELIQVRKSIKESYFVFDDEAAAGATLDEFRKWPSYYPTCAILLNC